MHPLDPERKESATNRAEQSAFFDDLLARAPYQQWSQVPIDEQPLITGTIDRFKKRIEDKNLSLEELPCQGWKTGTKLNAVYKEAAPRGKKACDHALSQWFWDNGHHARCALRHAKAIERTIDGLPCSTCRDAADFDPLKRGKAATCEYQHCVWKDDCFTKRCILLHPCMIKMLAYAFVLMGIPRVEAEHLGEEYFGKHTWRLPRKYYHFNTLKGKLKPKSDKSLPPQGSFTFETAGAHLTNPYMVRKEQEDTPALEWHAALYDREEFLRQKDEQSTGPSRPAPQGPMPSDPLPWWWLCQQRAIYLKYDSAEELWEDNPAKWHSFARKFRIADERQWQIDPADFLQPKPEAGPHKSQPDGDLNGSSEVSKSMARTESNDWLLPQDEPESDLEEELEEEMASKVCRKVGSKRRARDQRRW